MKVDNNSLKSVGGLPAGDPHARSVRGQSGASTPQGGARVELSSLSSQLQELESNLANVPVIDAGRVTEIKQAISEGRFKVDADKVADGLIESVRQMLSMQAPKA